MSTKKGQEAEERASTYLKKHGYSIIGRNMRLARGELDIVATKKALLVFIEVKSRQHHDDALLSLTPQKCRRIKSAAQAFLVKHRQWQQHQCRFDAILIAPDIENGIEHLEDILH
ncbi:MAG: YraN family protein [Mariprofundaceae bacterium]|nr:YraN family protein [Mariprofundaceae bacterium]